MMYPSFTRPIILRRQSRGGGIKGSYYPSVSLSARPLINKDRLSLTIPRDALHHGERAANK